MKITNISIKGLDLIKKYEGFRSKPYLCPAKVPTIGYGTTYYSNGTKVKLTDEAIDKGHATILLIAMLNTYEKAVDSYTTDNITQNQFDALVSLAYNIGVGNLKSSTLLKKINNNSKDLTIQKEFMKWVNAGGKKLEGLVKRRTEEAILYFK